jgi:disulfide bond formation protein DsbB
VTGSLLGSPPARWAALVWLAAVVAIATALTLQLGFGVQPCHLCLWERAPYYAVIVLVPALLLLRRPRVALAVGGLLLLGDAGLSLYHVAVEQGWVALPASCVSAGQAHSIDELRAQLAHAAPTCDQVNASFLGLSLAIWNLIAAALLGIASLAAIRSGAEQHRQARAV